MKIFYDSRTGNVKRFMSKVEKALELRGISDYKIIKIEEDTIVDSPSHLITYTTGFGELPKKTENFLENAENHKKIISISSSGNMNWGKLYAKACDKVYEKYGILTLIKFELSGTMAEASTFVEKIINSEEENG